MHKTAALRHAFFRNARKTREVCGFRPPPPAGRMLSLTRAALPATLPILIRFSDDQAISAKSAVGCVACKEDMFAALSGRDTAVVCILGWSDQLPEHRSTWNIQGLSLKIRLPGGELLINIEHFTEIRSAVTTARATGHQSTNAASKACNIQRPSRARVNRHYTCHAHNIHSDDGRLRVSGLFQDKVI